MLISKYSVKQVPICNILHINCKDAIYGRLLSLVAKISQNPVINKIYLTDIQNIIIKDKLSSITQKYNNKMKLGLDRGPYYSRTSTRFIKRILRCMYKKNNVGKQQLKKVITWIKSPVADIQLTFGKPTVKYMTRYSDLINKLK